MVKNQLEIFELKIAAFYGNKTKLVTSSLVLPGRVQLLLNRMCVGGTGGNSQSNVRVSTIANMISLENNTLEFRPRHFPPLGRLPCGCQFPGHSNNSKQKPPPWISFTLVSICLSALVKSKPNNGWNGRSILKRGNWRGLNSYLPALAALDLDSMQSQS